MNVALPALLFFVTLLPGVIGRAGIKRVERQSIDYAPFGRFLTDAILFAVALHALWLGVVYAISDRALDVATVLGILSTSPDLQQKAILKVAGQWDEVVLYFATLLAFAYLAFPAIRWCISSRGYDRRDHPLSKLFRFNDAPWYYLLTGADFEPSERPDYIKVSAVVNLSGDAFLYVGVLTDFFLCDDGSLERVVLSNAFRRPIAKDKDDGKSDDSRFYPIDGNYFVIRASEMTTFNVQYFRIERPREVQSEAGEDPNPETQPGN